MSLITARKSIITVIKAGLTSLKTCEEHGGRFDANELKRVAKKSPAVYLAALAVNNVDEDSLGYHGVVTWAAFVIAKGDSVTNRAEVALGVVNSLGLLIPGNNWAVEEFRGRPKKIRSQNLFSSSIDKLGVAMWGVTWQQWTDLGETTDLATLNDFVKYHAEHSMAPGTDEPEAIDEITLEQ